MSAESVITKYLPCYPQGSPGELRYAATVWRAVAEQVRTQIEDTKRQVAPLAATWQGAAKTAFEAQWTRFAAAVLDGCDDLDHVASSLGDYATKLEDAQHVYDLVAGGAALTVVAGVALTVFTFGASDAVAAEAVSTEVEAGAAAVEEADSILSELLDMLADNCQDLLRKTLISFTASLVEQAGTNYINDPNQSFFNDVKEVSPTEAAATAGVSLWLPDLPGGPAAQIAFGFGVGASQEALGQWMEYGTIKDPGLVIFEGDMGGLEGATDSATGGGGDGDSGKGGDGQESGKGGDGGEKDSGNEQPKGGKR
jgi:WXG100 family type VII secretion target